MSETDELGEIEARALASQPIVGTDGATLLVDHPSPWETARRVIVTFNPHYPHSPDLEFFRAARPDVLRAVAIARAALAAVRAPEPPPRPALAHATSYPALVGAVLASLRRRSLATPAEVAAVLGLREGAWRAVERGSPRLTLPLLARFGDFAGVEPGEVLARADAARARLLADGFEVRATLLSPGDARREGVILLDAEALAEVVARCGS